MHRTSNSLENPTHVSGQICPNQSPDPNPNPANLTDEPATGSRRRLAGGGSGRSSSAGQGYFGSGAGVDDDDDDDRGRYLDNSRRRGGGGSGGGANRNRIADDNGANQNSFLTPHIYKQKRTERGVLSVSKLCYVFPCELRGPAWAVGSYEISQLAKHYLQNLATDTTSRSVVH